MSDSSRDSFDALREDFTRLREDVGRLSNTLRRFGLQNPIQAEEKMDESLDKLRERLKARGGKKDRLKNTSFAQIGERLGKQPLLGVAAAFGAGFVLAKLLTRGEKR